MLAEAPDAGMAEEQSADHVTRPALDRHGQVASHRQVARRHPVMGRVVAVARILRDVRAPDHGRPPEGRREDLRVPRHRKLGERVARHARDRVERVGLAAVVHQVVEEGAELGGRQFGGGIGHCLDHLVAVQIRGDDGADVVQGLGDLGSLLQEPDPFGFCLLQGGNVARDLRRADNPARVIPHRRDRQRDVEATPVLGHAHGLEVFDAFAPPQPGQDVVFLRLALRRNQHCAPAARPVRRTYSRRGAPPTHCTTG